MEFGHILEAEQNPWFWVDDEKHLLTGGIEDSFLEKTATPEVQEDDNTPSQSVTEDENGADNATLLSDEQGTDSTSSPKAPTTKCGGELESAPQNSVSTVATEGHSREVERQHQHIDEASFLRTHILPDASQGDADEDTLRKEQLFRYVISMKEDQLTLAKKREELGVRKLREKLVTMQSLIQQKDSKILELEKENKKMEKVLNFVKKNLYFVFLQQHHEYMMATNQVPEQNDIHTLTSRLTGENQVDLQGLREWQNVSFLSIMNQMLKQSNEVSSATNDTNKPSSPAKSGLLGTTATATPSNASALLRDTHSMIEITKELNTFKAKYFLELETRQRLEAKLNELSSQHSRLRFKRAAQTVGRDPPKLEKPLEKEEKDNPQQGDSTPAVQQPPADTTSSNLAAPILPPNASRGSMRSRSSYQLSDADVEDEEFPAGFLSDPPLELDRLPTFGGDIRSKGRQLRTLQRFAASPVDIKNLAKVAASVKLKAESLGQHLLPASAMAGEYFTVAPAKIPQGLIYSDIVAETRNLKQVDTLLYHMLNEDVVGKVEREYKSKQERLLAIIDDLQKTLSKKQVETRQLHILQKSLQKSKDEDKKRTLTDRTAVIAKLAKATTEEHADDEIEDAVTKNSMPAFVTQSVELTTLASKAKLEGDKDNEGSAGGGGAPSISENSIAITFSPDKEAVATDSGTPDGGTAIPPPIGRSMSHSGGSSLLSLEDRPRSKDTGATSLLSAPSTGSPATPSTPAANKGKKKLVSAISTVIASQNQSLLKREVVDTSRLKYNANQFFTQMRKLSLAEKDKEHLDALQCELERLLKDERKNNLTRVVAQVRMKRLKKKRALSSAAFFSFSDNEGTSPAEHDPEALLPRSASVSALTDRYGHTTTSGVEHPSETVVDGGLTSIYHPGTAHQATQTFTMSTDRSVQTTTRTHHEHDGPKRVKKGSTSGGADGKAGPIPPSPGFKRHRPPRIQPTERKDSNDTVHSAATSGGAFSPTSRLHHRINSDTESEYTTDSGASSPNASYYRGTSASLGRGRLASMHRSRKRKITVNRATSPVTDAQHETLHAKLLAEEIAWKEEQIKALTRQSENEKGDRDLQINHLKAQLETMTDHMGSFKKQLQEMKAHQKKELEEQQHRHQIAVSDMKRQVKESQKLLEWTQEGYRLKEDQRLQQAQGPVGEVTLVFTDIQSSSQLWDQRGDAMRRSLAFHNGCLRKLILDHDGFEVKTEGDAFMIAFDSPQNALAFTCASQIELLDVPWPDELLSHPAAKEERDSYDQIVFRGLRVRMGFTTGTPRAEADPVSGRTDYFGHCVNLSARIGGLPKGGQICMGSASYKKLHETNGLGNVTCLSLGKRQLKGIKEPEEVYSVLPLTLACRTFDGTLGTGGVHERRSSNWWLSKVNEVVKKEKERRKPLRRAKEISVDTHDLQAASKLCNVSRTKVARDGSIAINWDTPSAGVRPKKYIVVLQPRNDSQTGSTVDSSATSPNISVTPSPTSNAVRGVTGEGNKGTTTNTQLPLLQAQMIQEQFKVALAAKSAANEQYHHTVLPLHQLSAGDLNTIAAGSIVSLVDNSGGDINETVFNGIPKDSKYTVMVLAAEEDTSIAAAEGELGQSMSMASIHSTASLHQLISSGSVIMSSAAHSKISATAYHPTTNKGAAATDDSTTASGTTSTIGSNPTPATTSSRAATPRSHKHHVRVLSPPQAQKAAGALKLNPADAAGTTTIVTSQPIPLKALYMASTMTEADSHAHDLTATQRASSFAGLLHSYSMPAFNPNPLVRGGHDSEAKLGNNALPAAALSSDGRASSVRSSSPRTKEFHAVGQNSDNPRRRRCPDGFCYCWKCGAGLFKSIWTCDKCHTKLYYGEKSEYDKLKSFKLADKQVMSIGVQCTIITKGPDKVYSRMKAHEENAQKRWNEKKQRLMKTREQSVLVHVVYGGADGPHPQPPPSSPPQSTTALAPRPHSHHLERSTSPHHQSRLQLTSPVTRSEAPSPVSLFDSHAPITPPPPAGLHHQQAVNPQSVVVGDNSGNMNIGDEANTHHPINTPTTSNATNQEVLSKQQDSKRAHVLMMTPTSPSGDSPQHPQTFQRWKYSSSGNMKPSNASPLASSNPTGSTPTTTQQKPETPLNSSQRVVVQSPPTYEHQYIRDCTTPQRAASPNTLSRVPSYATTIADEHNASIIIGDSIVNPSMQAMSFKNPNKRPLPDINGGGQSQPTAHHQLDDPIITINPTTSQSAPHVGQQPDNTLHDNIHDFPHTDNKEDSPSTATVQDDILHNMHNMSIISTSTVFTHTAHGELQRLDSELTEASSLSESLLDQHSPQSVTRRYQPSDSPPPIWPLSSSPAPLKSALRKSTQHTTHHTRTNNTSNMYHHPEGLDNNNNYNNLQHDGVTVRGKGGRGGGRGNKQWGNPNSNTGKHNTNNHRSKSKNHQQQPQITGMAQGATAPSRVGVGRTEIQRKGATPVGRKRRHSVSPHHKERRRSLQPPNTSGTTNNATNNKNTVTFEGAVVPPHTQATAPLGLLPSLPPKHQAHRTTSSPEYKNSETDHEQPQGTTFPSIDERGEEADNEEEETLVPQRSVLEMPTISTKRKQQYRKTKDDAGRNQDQYKPYSLQVRSSSAHSQIFNNYRHPSNAGFDDSDPKLT